MPDPAASDPPLAPPRRDGVRRTSHIDIGPRTKEGWASDAPLLTITGGVRDLVTAGTDATVRGEATLRLELDAARAVAAAEVEPPLALPLVGTPAFAGFRQAVIPALDPPQQPLAQLLSDVPTIVLVSGYAHMRDRLLAGVPGGAMVPPRVLGRMADLCAGWRADGAMAGSILAGTGVPIQDCPPAQDEQRLDDPLAYHRLPSLPRGHMRRLRRVDVVIVGQQIEIDAIFRDTYAQAADDVRTLHAYALRVRADAATETITDLDATAHVVPFGECLAAAASPQRLVGHTLSEARAVATHELAGVIGCTHLNDLLACLVHVPTLAGC